MRRKVFDALVSTGGLVLAAILLVAGGLLVWAHTFVDNNVHTQLSQQQIFFPDKAGIAAQSNADITKYVTSYAGQQVRDVVLHGLLGEEHPLADLAVGQALADEVEDLPLLLGQPG